MQAPGSLSKSQVLALESCWLFLHTLGPLLVALGEELGPASRLLLDGQIRLAALNESRLLEAFPEVADAKRRWSAGAGGMEPL